MKKRLYDSIGSYYSATRRADAGIASTLFQLARVQPLGTYLDLACGSGNYTLALSQKGGNWYGLDHSEVMLKQAMMQKGKVQWDLGCAESLPYPDENFDAIVCVNAIHFLDINESLNEAYRVLKNGRLVLFCALAEQLEYYWLREYFPNMMCRAIDSMPSANLLTEHLHNSHFCVEDIVSFEIEASLTDLFLYSGKLRPQLYLDFAVTSNMSQFVRFCDADELTSGMERLKSDLSAGRFAAVSRRYTTSAGDCAYIVASKKNGVASDLAPGNLSVNSKTYSNRQGG